MYTPNFRTNRANVPILSKNELDDIGEELVADFCPQAMKSPMEIDVDRFITRYLGLEQDFQFLSHCGLFLGMTVFNDTNRVRIYNPQLNRAEYLKVRAGTVIIDNSLLNDNQEHRYRFTAGHEAAHGILHPGYFAYNPNQLSMFGDDYVPMVQCRVDFTKGFKKPVTRWSDKDWMEWQANRLASAILMPKSMVLRVAHEAEDTQLLSVNHDGDSDSTGAICGNILGAMYGLPMLPEEWTAKVEIKDFIIAMADALYKETVSRTQ